MRISIKSHLLTEIITLIINTFILCFTFYLPDLPLSLKENFELFLLGEVAILGLSNTFYLFAQLCAQHCFTKAWHVVLWFVAFPLQWALFIYLSLPLMLVEIIMICIGKEHIGSGKGDVIIDNYDGEQMLLNAEEQTLYNDFVKGYRMKRVITNIIALFSVVIYGCLTTVINNVFILLVILLIIFILIFFVSIRLRTKYTVTLIKEICATVGNQCDSRAYYHVSKALCEKYPNNTLLVEHYVYSLQIDDNDYSELKRALKRFRSYEDWNFYLLAYMNLLPKEEYKRFFNESYERIKKDYEKAYQKTKINKYLDNMILLDIMRHGINGEYEEALKLFDSIKYNETKLDKVLFAFNKAACLKRLGRQKECEELLAYVVKEGNTLRVKYRAKEYLKEMHPEMLEQDDKII